MGIGMYLYLPEDVGWGDTKRCGLAALAESNWVVDSHVTPKWNAVIKTWADRYGTKVRGWFFDGYEPAWGVAQAMAQAYRDTCLADNPCGIVAFNGANGDPVSDTQRGETSIDTSTGLPAKGLPTITDLLPTFVAKSAHIRRACCVTRRSCAASRSCHAGRGSGRGGVRLEESNPVGHSRRDGSGRDFAAHRGGLQGA
jgi:hypothetical protein